jgi:hypothetical protein
MKPPKLKDPVLEKAFKEVYDQLAKLKASKAAGVAKSPETQGEKGNMEVIKNEDGSYTMRVRHKDGWVTFNANASQFTK